MKKNNSKPPQLNIGGIYSETGPKSKRANQIQIRPYGNISRNQGASGGVSGTIPVATLRNKQKVDLQLGGYGGVNKGGRYGGYSVQASVRIPIGKKKKGK